MWQTARKVYNLIRFDMCVHLWSLHDDQCILQPQEFLLLFCDASLPPSLLPPAPSDNCWSASCRYRLVSIYYEFYITGRAIQDVLFSWSGFFYSTKFFWDMLMLLDVSFSFWIVFYRMDKSQLYPFTPSSYEPINFTEWKRKDTMV